MYTKSVYYVQNPYFKYNNCLICVYFVFQKRNFSRIIWIQPDTWNKTMRTLLNLLSYESAHSI